MNKRIFWIFRTDLKTLEKYHEINNLENFENECFDFYLLMPLFFVKNNDFYEVVIWRLFPEKKDDIIFNINGRRFVQRWVKDFRECFNYQKPDLTFFRGGFEIYDKLTNIDKDFFGFKLYLGASKRTFPQYGGIYDRILLEDDSDYINVKNVIPFYKTVNENIFKPLNLKEIKYDICWPANFTQIKQKGQEFFINEVSKSKFLKSLKIIHIGNKPEVGKDLCKKYNINNITFTGYRDRNDINLLLNYSKFGIVNSNKIDGCPRVSTEIIMSGTPLLKRKETRLLNFYKVKSVIEFDDNSIERIIRDSINNYDYLKENSIENIKIFSLENISKKNLKLWDNERGL